MIFKQENLIASVDTLLMIWVTRLEPIHYIGYIFIKLTIFYNLK